MSERWTPKKVKRMVTPEVRAEAARRRQLVDQHQRERRFVQGTTRLVLCTHNVNWLDCKLCSKPRSP